MAEQPRRTREQGHTAQQLWRQPNVGKRGTSHSSAVERQRAAKHLGMDSTNGLEEAQVRSPQALLLGKLDDHGGPGINGLMHRVAQSRNEAASSPLFGDRPAGKLVPLLIGRRELARDGCQHACEKAASVFCDAEEPRAATQQTRCHRTLERIWGAVQGQAGRDRGRGKAVISQRDEHSLEHTHLLRRRSLLCGEPESQLAKPDVPNQLAREIVTKQVNAGDIRRTDPGGIFHLFSLYVKSLVPLGVDVWRLAEPGANLFVILAERRRWQLVARRRPGERNRVTNHWHDIIPRANLDNWI